MVSTFLSYRLYSADMAKSVARTLADAQVKREAEYYRANIGNVTSIDDFLNDQRLYAYAMKAHGLEDMTYAKAFMRKVLESDLTKADSFVRKLVDPRYLAFARSFNFTPTGGVAPGTVVAQDVTEEAETVGLYSEQRVRQGAAAATEVEYYQSRIGTLTSVDQLVADPRLFSFALTAFGLDPSIASEATIRAVLTSDLSDPGSVANSLGDFRYQDLASAFSFASDGSVPSGGSAQTSGQAQVTVFLYYERTGNGTSPPAAAFKTEIYREMIAGISSAAGLADNDVLRTYILVAAGIDPVVTSKSTVYDVLTSDLSDPASLANVLGGGYRTLAEAFNFNTDGSLDDGVAAQDAAQQESLIDLYLANYDARAVAAEESQTEYYRLNIGSIMTVDELLDDAKLFSYILEAYGLDPATESKSRIKQVLQSDPRDPASFANRLRDSRYTALAAAFNFGADGAAQGGLRAQLASSKSETITRYTVTLGTLEADQARGKIESEYYNAAIDTIQTVDELLKDRRLVTYALRAFGVEEAGLSDEVLRQVLTSDLFDPKSFVNTQNDTRLRDLAAAFNFGTDGKVARALIGQAQERDDLARTQDLYLRQTMEQRAGEENPGVRLALYFQRKAASIDSAFSILADKALLEVVLTALGLPDTVTQADIDLQAKMITQRIDIADFKDPEKLERFLTRFTTLYDLNNPQTQPSIPSLLLGQQEAVSFGLDLLGSIQSLRLRS